MGSRHLLTLSLHLRNDFSFFYLKNYSFHCRWSGRFQHVLRFWMKDEYLFSLSSLLQTAMATAEQVISSYFKVAPHCFSFSLTSCYVDLSYCTSFYIISHHFTLVYISLHNFTSFYIILHHFTSFYIILHHFTSF